MSACAATYREGPAPPVLAPWVACTWELRAGSDGHVHRVLPDGCMDLLWDDASGLHAVGPNLTAFLAGMAPGAAVAGGTRNLPPSFGTTRIPQSVFCAATGELAASSIGTIHQRLIERGPLPPGRV